jgi:hypothetical protein
LKEVSQELLAEITRRLEVNAFMDEAKRNLLRHWLAIAQDAAKTFGFVFLLSSIISLAIIGCSNKDRITINENNIIFAGGKILLYTNKDKPKITLFDNNLEMADYDIPFIAQDHKGVILVHETIPYEGIDSSLTIYDLRGNLIRQINRRSGYFEVAPDHSFFIFVDEHFAEDFKGNVEFYSSVGILLNHYKFRNALSANPYFDKDSQYCAICAISNPCENIVYESRSNQISVFMLNWSYCAGQLPTLIDNDYILIMAEDYKQYYFAMLKPNATIVGEKAIPKRVGLDFKDINYNASEIGFRGKNARLVDSHGYSLNINFD